MKIKRHKYLILLLILLITLGTAGCGKKSNQPIKENNSLNLNLIGATIGGGGVWDLIATGVAETITQKLPGSTITSIPGEGVANVISVHNDEAELGLTHSSVAAAAYMGIDPFDEKINDVKAICALYESGLQFIADKDLPVNSIREMIDSKYKIKLAVGNPGSTGELATNRLLSEYGVSYKDIEAWGGKIYYKDMGEAADMLGDGLIDAFTLLTIAPAGPVQEVSNNNDLKMLPVEAEVVKALVDKYGYMDLSIANAAYDFIDEDITTFGSQVIIIANDRMTEEDVYKITKALVDNLDYLHQVHSNLKNLSVEKMAKGTGAPLHPGAEKYYKEAKVLP